jgi:hypothetical protein
LTDRSKLIRSTTCSADPADVELVSQQDVSMDEELGIRALKTPGVKKAMKEAMHLLKVN